MSLIIDTPEEITPEWLTAVLREAGLLAEHDGVLAVDVDRFEAGNMGVVCRSILTYDSAAQQAPASVIVKLASHDPGSRAFCLATHAYENEARFYQDIAPLVDIDLPQAIWSAFDPASGLACLILEDLSGDWEVGNSVVGGTVEQAYVVLDQLVGLQAPLWNDVRFKQHPWLDASGMLQELFDSVPPAVPRFAERFEKRLDPSHMALVRELGPKAGRLAPMICRPPVVIAHSDFRLDNIFFSTGPGPLRAKTVDWQTVRLSAPLVDVSIYLNTCLSVRDRHDHHLDLLKHYHAGLVAKGVRNFSFDDCFESYRLCSLNYFLLLITVAVALRQTERGDDMFVRMFTTCASAVADLDSARCLA